MGNKVLIVDDDPSIRRLLNRILRDMGHSTIEAADGNEALVLLQSENPALILLDLHMPRLDGLATLEAILESNPEMGVIMMTGDGDEERGKAAMQRGACDYLPKPFDLDYLRNTVMANLLVRGQPAS